MDTLNSWSEKKSSAGIKSNTHNQLFTNTHKQFSSTRVNVFSCILCLCRLRCWGDHPSGGTLSQGPGDDWGSTGCSGARVGTTQGPALQESHVARSDMDPHPWTFHFNLPKCTTPYESADDHPCSKFRMWARVQYRIKPEELYILSCGKGRGRRPGPFPQLRMQSSEGFNWL